MRQIFLISGKAGAGKDSTANFIMQKIPGKTLIVHNADYLKYIAKQYMDWNGEKDTYGRTLLQQIGTNRVRYSMKRPLYWVEKTCDVIEILQEDYDYFIVPDVRFFNEIYYTNARFPEMITTVRIVRENFDSGLSKEQKDHPSEIELDSFKHDYYINSESGLGNLEKQVDIFINRYDYIFRYVR